MPTLTPKALYAWDFLLGVEDVSRQGALRYRRLGEEAFLAHDALTVPPVTSLKELEAVAREISAKRIDDLESLRQWLKVLVAPGTSLGGARPKASFTETDGSLWIAKFPAHDDTRDVGAWEAVVQRLAARAGIDVPASELRRFRGEYHTFCVRRFDRVGTRRRFYASAMALLRKDQSEGLQGPGLRHRRQSTQRNPTVETRGTNARNRTRRYRAHHLGIRRVRRRERLVRTTTRGTPRQNHIAPGRSGPARGESRQLTQDRLAVFSGSSQ